MNNHYFKSAIRTILKDKGNAVINLVGLSIGLACCIMISLQVYQEFSFDRFHKDRDRIFEVCYQFKQIEKTETSYLHPVVLSQKLKEEIPQVENSSAFQLAWMVTMKHNDQYFQELLALAEPDFFNIFSFKLLSGNPKSLLKSPNDIVITMSLAKKLMDQNKDYLTLIGKTIEFPNNTGNKVYTIVGILDELPDNSSLRFSMLIPFDQQERFSQSNNTFGNTSLFVKAKPGISSSKLAEMSTQTLLSFYDGKIKELQNNNVLAKTADCFLPLFLPLTKIHLDTPFYNDYILQGKRANLYILIGIGLLILFVGCCNFIILSLGQVMKRAKNFGIRKVVGAQNVTIFKYCFTEVNILVFIAFLIALLLSYSFLPLYVKFANTRIDRNLIFNPSVIFILFLIYLLIVSINSMAPVLFISKSKAANLFRKKRDNNVSDRLPLLFITVQYSLSVFLIISSMFIVSQIRYMKYKDLGFNAENVLYIPVTDIPAKQRMIFRDRLKTHPGIVDVAASNMNFINGRNEALLEKENGEHVEARLIRADENYIRTLGLQLIQGRNFTFENMNENDRNIIINEKLLAGLEIKGDPVGKTINIPGDPLPVTVIGIIKDFHFDSMKDILQPMALTVISRPGNAQYLFVRTQANSIADVIPFINQTWDSFVTDRKAQILFWDQQLEQRYRDEERWARIISYASMFSIFITSLGLFGLTLLLISKKTKEIGIRKVNGARISEILMMLNTDFLKWVFIAIVIAIPVAWYAMHKWLENFAYKTNLSWWIFALAGILALGIALFTVSWQSWRAATRNPVEALRYE